MLNLLFEVDNLSNHSISIINRNLIKYFKQSEGINIVNKKHSDIHIELRHTYPPNFRLSTAKILVFIIPWEFSKVPTEWILNLKFLGSTPTHLIVPSQFTKNIFINCGLNESMIHVIPNGIDFSVFFPKPHLQPSTFKQFIFIGNNSPRKGLDCLLEAWKQADLQSSQLIIKTTSFIYGHDPIYSSISNTYKNVKVIDKELSENELSDLLASSHIIVSPYRGESYGMCIAEAMACGVFPLVTKNGATDDYIMNEHCKIPSIKVKSNIFSYKTLAIASHESIAWSTVNGTATILLRFCLPEFHVLDVSTCSNFNEDIPSSSLLFEFTDVSFFKSFVVIISNISLFSILHDGEVLSSLLLSSSLLINANSPKCKMILNTLNISFRSSSSIFKCLNAFKTS